MGLTGDTAFTKRFLAGFLILAAIILLLALRCHSLDGLSDNDIVSCEYDRENYAVRFMADSDYAFTYVGSEYGKLNLPHIPDESADIQAVSVNLDTLRLHDGEFIYLHLRNQDAANHDFQIYIYEILYQNEKELYIARCKNSAGGIYERVDVYNPETGELSASR